MFRIDKLNDALGYAVFDDETEFKLIYKACSYYVNGYQFMPSYKNGFFDGMVHLMSFSNKTFPLGLAEHIIKTAEANRIDIEVSQSIKDSFINDISETEIKDFSGGYHFFSKGIEIFPRSDQMEAVQRAISLNRCVNLCPTSFGKSLSITIECLYHIAKGRKCIIIVPTKDLVDQFCSDINDYATNTEGKKEGWLPKIQIMYAGKKKELEEDTDIMISTWQSLSKIEDETYLNQYDVVIVDEAHKSKAKILRTMLLGCDNVKFRTGWTGTLSNNEIDGLLVQGCFGPVKQIITTKELMDKDIVTQLKIVMVKLTYEETLAKELVQLDYTSQTQYIENCIPRNDKILSLVGTMKSTGLIFYSKIAHGEMLMKMAKKKYPDRNVYFIHGGHFQRNEKKYKTFEDLKPLIEEDETGIVICNFQVAGTGVSIKNIHYIVFATDIKSSIMVLQAIGRGLRKNANKSKVILVDVIDDFSVKKRKNVTKNYALKHFFERYNIYNENQFNYKMINIELINMPSYAEVMAKTIRKKTTSVKPAEESFNKIEINIDGKSLTI